MYVSVDGAPPVPDVEAAVTLAVGDRQWTEVWLRALRDRMRPLILTRETDMSRTYEAIRWAGPRLLCAIGMAPLLSTLLVTAAFAQTIDSTSWVSGPVPGTVMDMELSHGSVYLGGNFDEIGPATGHGVPLDLLNGLPVPGFPRVAGPASGFPVVRAAVSDGAGGWFIGGEFEDVGGLPRRNLAHILADNSVSPWNPGTSGGSDIGVYTLLLSGSTLYVGGGFANVGGQVRNNLAAINAGSGIATSWNPNATSAVWALAVSGTTIYAGGSFTNIGGQPRNRIAALSATTGLATTWNPNAGNDVKSLAVSGGTVYAGGNFATIGGQTRARIAALSAATGLATTWNPSANESVEEIVISGTTVYAGGYFTNIGGQPRRFLAALSASTGLATAWNPDPDGDIRTLAISGATVYAGGTFRNIGGQARDRIAAVDATTGLATAWDPDANEAVYTLAISGSAIYAGGFFCGFGGTHREHLAAVDLLTGEVTDWNPGALLFPYALSAKGSTIYTGGEILEVGGQPRNYIAAVDAITGIPTAWNPDASSYVFDIATDDSTVYVSGDFSNIGGEARNGIAALDPFTGHARAWNANSDGSVQSVRVSPSAVIVVGSFSNIGGQPRDGIAALDPVTGLATSWNPGGGSAVSTIAVHDSTLYVGGGFTDFGGVPRDRIAAINTRTGIVTDWDPGADGFVSGIEIDGSTVYVSGLFTTIGGATRSGLAALDAITGLVLPWNPAVTGVDEMRAVGAKLYCMGSIRVGAGPVQSFASISAAPALTGIAPTGGGNHGVLSVTLHGSGIPSGATVKLTRTGQGDIFGTSVVVATDAKSLTATFDLTGALVGAWDVVLTTPDAQGAMLAAGFAVATQVAPHLRVDLVGPTEIRANYPAAFDLVVTNVGNVDAQAVPLWLAGVPAGVTVTPGFAVSAPPASGGEPDWSTVPLTLVGGAGQYLCVVLPRVAPGITVRRVNLQAPASVSTMTLRAGVAAPWGDDTSRLRECLMDAGVTLAIPCLTEELADFRGYLEAHLGLEAMNGVGIWAREAWRCEGASSFGAAVAKAEAVLDRLVLPFEQPGSLPASCAEAADPRWRSVLNVGVGGSVDPNAKSGVTEPLMARQRLPFTVHFENLAEATATAQQVMVDDQLDLALLDISSVHLTSLSIGDRTLLLPTGVQSFEGPIVDLRPDLPVLVKVSGRVERMPGVLKWQFLTLDPATGAALDLSSLLGFLPPNTAPPQGQGTATFSVSLRSDLSPGTLIRNQASLTFDAEAPMQTEFWENTLLDGDAPASRVLPLAASHDSAEFMVHWEATGAPADLRDFTVYVSVDGAPYHAWKQSTPLSSGWYPAQQGAHQYRFYSTARDVSGNVEGTPPVPDAETAVTLAVGDEGMPLRLTLEGARPNPAVGRWQAWFTLPGEGPATLELIDVSGRRVLREQVGDLGPGRHARTLGGAGRLAPGLYWLRLVRQREVRTSKVVVVN